MSTPLACAICLVDGRPEMLKRAIASFEAQTYERKGLLLWGDPQGVDFSRETAFAVVHDEESRRGLSIGELRNQANFFAVDMMGAEVLIHWDSDDLSHPRRIEEQLALLESSGAEAVGYNEAIFWRQGEWSSPVGTNDPVGLCISEREGCPDYPHEHWRDKGSAYLYSNPRPNYAIGASLAYWRSTWQRRPFPHLPIPGNRQSAGEDAEWLKGVKCVAVSSIGADVPLPGLPVNDLDPSLICSIHGQNSQAYDLALASPYFKRAAWFDDYCRAQMRLEGK